MASAAKHFPVVLTDQEMQKAINSATDFLERLCKQATFKAFGRTVPGKAVVASAAVVTATAAASFLYLGLRNAPLPLGLLKQKRNLHYLAHPLDVIALGKFYFTSKLPEIPKDLDADWTWCYQKLVFTSRSFAAVILELSEELRGAVALFYLVLRALDTIGTPLQEPNFALPTLVHPRSPPILPP